MFDLQFDQKEREKKQHLFVKNVEIQQHIVVKMFYRGILIVNMVYILQLSPLLVQF
jgi:hypothetical protein